MDNLNKCIICNNDLNIYYNYKFFYRKECNSCDAFYDFKEETDLLEDIFIFDFQGNEERIFSYHNNVITLPYITINYISSDKDIDNAYFISLIKKYLDNKIFL